MLHRDDVWMAADAAVTEEERRTFLDHFPRLRGAHVADVLDILDNHDAMLRAIEPMYEAHHHEVPEPGVLTAATLLVGGIVGEDNVTWELVQPLVERIRARLQERQS